VKKLFVSVALGLLLAVVPVSIFARADCRQIITIGAGTPGAQTCILDAQYTINGVQFCEYACSTQ
jgi:hypothetical protein